MMLDVKLESQVNPAVSDNGAINSVQSKFLKKHFPLGFRTYKNVFVICLAFLFQFAAFSAIANLQSSLNTDANVGINSLSIIYVCLLLSATFLPHPSIAAFGLKWTIVISQIP